MWKKKSFAAFACAGVLFLHSTLTTFAASKTELALEANRAMPIQSNEVANWPAGPMVGAESAILMELETGAILYAATNHRKWWLVIVLQGITMILYAPVLLRRYLEYDPRIWASIWLLSYFVITFGRIYTFMGKAEKKTEKSERKGEKYHA